MVELAQYIFLVMHKIMLIKTEILRIIVDKFEFSEILLLVSPEEMDSFTSEISC